MTQAAPGAVDRHVMDPPRSCSRCERLVAFRHASRVSQPSWYNGPVPAFGHRDARLLIVGLAPGLKGANRTGRPFTGDYAGELLYATLLEFGFASGTYEARPDDGLQLRDCVITNAVCCVPPGNKPTPAELDACRPYLDHRLTQSDTIRSILVLGRIAHDSTLDAQRLPRRRFPFAHGATHPLPGGRVLYDSFHCSRLNTNTGRLTAAMFREVFARIRADLDSADTHSAR